MHAGRQPVAGVDQDHAQSVRQHHEIAETTVAARMQVLGQLLAEIRPGVRQPRVQPVAQGACAARVAEVQADRGTGLREAHPGQLRLRPQHGGAVRIRRRHPVVRDDDEDDAAGVRQRVDALHQPSQQPVGALDAPPHARIARAEAVAGAVHQREVEGDEVRAFRRPQGQPRQHLLDALAVRDAPVVRPPVARAHAADVGLRAREEERGRDQALGFRGDPDRLAAPPRAVLRVAAAAITELRPAHRIEELVADHPVRLRMQSGGDGVVSRKGERGKDADEAGRAHPTRREAVEVGRVEAGEIVRVEAVERDEDDERPRLDAGPVDPAGPGRPFRLGARRRAARDHPGDYGNEPRARRQILSERVR